MRILHIAPMTFNKYSGLTYSIPALSQAQNNIEEINSEILVSLKTKTKSNNYYYIENFRKKRDLILFLEKYDIFIFHSTYIFAHIKIAKILKTLSLPYIIVPRGGFSKVLRKRKYIKKFFGDLIFFRNYFTSPNAIHFLTQNEKTNSRFNTESDFILPNGIYPSNISMKESSEMEDIKCYKLVYIGRLDIFIKGLDLIVDAINILINEYFIYKIKLELYGPSFNNSKILLEKQIKKKSLEKYIYIKDPIYDKEKRNILSQSDFFIQASRSEGLPMGILEALSYGIPCIVSVQTNLSKKIVSHEAGIEVELNPKSIAKGIYNIISKDIIKLKRNAVSLSKEFYWPNIAKESIKIYNNIIKLN